MNLDTDIVTNAKSVNISRRGFLKKSAFVAGAAMMSQSELLASVGEKKVLKLYNVHMDKTFYAPFFERNYYKLSGLFEINKAFVDYRQREITRVDVKLINLLYDLKLSLGTDSPFNIVSGYRTPKTNNMLRRTHRGVAKNSLHTKGKAVDIYIPNVSLRKVRDTAIGLAQGGVGYYPRSNFVHVDVGPIRTWGG